MLDAERPVQRGAGLLEERVAGVTVGHLQVSAEGGARAAERPDVQVVQPGDARPTDVGGRISPVWGLHLIDMNLAMGDLVDLAGRQIAAR